MRYFWRRFFGRRRLEEDLRAELDSHLSMDAHERIERGADPASARAEAQREFGNSALVAEVTRETWGFARLEELFQDLRYALRTLRNAPVFTAVASLVLALGIGSTTAIFSLVDGVLLRPLPFPDSERLAMIWEVPAHTNAINVVALDNFVAWQQRSRSFESMAAFYELPMNLLSSYGSEQVPGLAVSSEFFHVLGTPPLLGRVFRPGEYYRDEPKRVVLSYAAWQRLFGGRRDVIGKRISVNATHHEVIGVMPPGFRVENSRAELYVPLGILLDTGRNYSVVARLRKNVTVSEARAEMAGIAAQTARENHELNAGWSATVVPLLDQTVGDMRPVLRVLFAAVALLLLIACANVANLLLMRGMRRKREISVRLALGASAGRVLRQLLVESLVLSLTGGTIGLALAWLALRTLVANIPSSISIPRLAEVSMNPSVLLFALAVSTATGMIFGVAPALQALKTDVARDLHESGRSITSGSKLRGALVVGEVALAFVLVTGAGLMFRSFVRLANVNPGFHAEHVLTARMLLLPVKKQEWHAEAVNEMLQRIRALPGVIAAGSIGILPMQGTNSGTWYYPADAPEPEASRRPAGDVSVITPGYFRALGIPVIQGRDFNDHDRAGAPRVAILNQTAAKMLFPGENAIGKRVKVWWTNTPVVQIVGIAHDIRHSKLNSPPDPCLFLPNDQDPFPFSALVIRTTGDPARLASAVREQIRQVDAYQGIADIESMEQLVADSIARPRLETMLLSAFGFIALSLACLGIYGLIAYSVTQRAREIGIRVALGASRQSVFRMVVGEGFRLMTFGLCIGSVSALLLNRFLRTLLFEVQPDDPLTLAMVAVILAVTAVAACYLPARGAMRVDPATVLRQE